MYLNKNHLNLVECEKSDCSVIQDKQILNVVLKLPYLPYIFGQIKIIIFFTVRTFNLEKNYKFFSVRIFMNAEKLPIIEGIHRYTCICVTFPYIPIGVKIKKFV